MRIGRALHIQPTPVAIVITTNIYTLCIKLYLSVELNYCESLLHLKFIKTTLRKPVGIHHRMLQSSKSEAFLSAVVKEWTNMSELREPIIFSNKFRYSLDVLECPSTAID